MGPHTTRMVIGLGVLAVIPLALTRCGGSSTAPAPEIPITMRVFSSSGQLLPHWNCDGIVEVTTPSGVPLDSVRITLTGALDSSRTYVVGDTNTFYHHGVYTAPPNVGAGTITLTGVGYAGASSATGATIITIADTVHPSVSGATASNQSVFAPGDSLILNVAASDQGAITYTGVKMSGSFAFADSVSANYASYITRSVRIVVPADASTSSPLRIVVSTANVGGIAASDTLPDITIKSP